MLTKHSVRMQVWIELAQDRDKGWGHGTEPSEAGNFLIS
jgi:hypothetical protein